MFVKVDKLGEINLKNVLKVEALNNTIKISTRKHYKKGNKLGVVTYKTNDKSFIDKILDYGFVKIDNNLFVNPENIIGVIHKENKTFLVTNTYFKEINNKLINYNITISKHINFEPKGKEEFPIPYKQGLCLDTHYFVTPCINNIEENKYNEDIIVLKKDGVLVTIKTTIKKDI